MSRKAGSKVPMNTQAVARIYAAKAKAGDGTIPKGGFEARAAKAADVNARTTTKGK